MILDALLGLIALCLLVLPGALFADGSNARHPVLGGFLGGAVGLVGIVIIVDALQLPLTLWSVGGIWLAAIIGSLYFWGTRPVRASSTPEPKLEDRSPTWLLIVLVPACYVVIYRATLQPLFGVDTIFRWNYLAEQMLARRSLDFYPPFSAADFTIYSWPDAIAPAVSSLYFWTYALAGATRPSLTAPLIFFQFSLLIFATYLLAKKQASARAGLFACSLAAGSPIVLWAVSMGQESGLMAIATLAMLIYLPSHRGESVSANVALAGLAAGLGALSREYGLILPAIGLVLCVVRRLSTPAIMLFSATAALSALPWYIRTAIITGNPFYNMSVGGLFPVNVVHASLNAAYMEEFGSTRIPSGAFHILLVNAAIGIAGLILGSFFYRRGTSALLTTAGVFALLWIASVGFTAAGFTYSLRVLTPALLIGAILGGIVLARWLPNRRHLGGVTLALGLVGCDAALRALTLPVNVYRLPATSWLTVGGAVHDYHNRPIYREIVRLADDRRILTLGPNALLTTLGANTLPLWSPEVAYLFNHATKPAVAAERLLAANIAFVLLNTGTVNERFLSHSRFFRDPEGCLMQVWADEDMVLLRVMRTTK